MRHGRQDEGASAVEYALLVAGIAAIVVLIVFALGRVVSELFDKTCTNIQAEANTSQSC